MLKYQFKTTKKSEPFRSQGFSDSILIYTEEHLKDFFCIIYIRVLKVPAFFLVHVLAGAMKNGKYWWALKN